MTKTKSKGLEWKQHIIEDIRSCVEKYTHIYVFSVTNMRNNLLKELRNEWKHSRFFFGKNRIMQLGLGKTESDETEENLHKLSARVHGQCGLLFTNKEKDEVLKWFEKYSALEYARSGFRATETVILPEGPLEDFSHSIEPHLRSLGMPVQLTKGIPTLYKEFTVCEKGKILTPEQARILKLISKPMAWFSLDVKCVWSKDGGYESFKADEEIEANENEGSDDNDIEMDE